MPNKAATTGQTNDQGPSRQPSSPSELTVQQSGIPALLLSLLFHVVIITAIGLSWSMTPKGTGDQADRPIGIAVVHRMPDRDRYADAAEIFTEAKKSEQADSSAASAAAAAAPADLTPPIDLDGILKSMNATPSPKSGTGLAGETDLSGDAFGNDRGTHSTADGEDLTTMVFGVSGSGRRFVYVFDRSDSMNGFGGKPLRAAKAELTRSLKTLTERQQFQIIFYNDKVKPFQVPGMPLQMVTGESAMVDRAQRYVQSIQAFGSTEHFGASENGTSNVARRCLLLTDARIPALKQSQLAEIRNRAEQAGATIHAIEFGPEPASPPDSFLRELARQNRGQYQYIDVRSLQAKPSFEEVKPETEKAQ